MESTGATKCMTALILGLALAGCSTMEAPATSARQGAATQTAIAQPSRHHFVKQGAGKMYKRDLLDTELKLSAPMTEGRFTYIDEVWFPGFKVGPHFHHSHAETFYVLSGRVEWTVNGETHQMGTGDLVYIPPDTVHSTKVIGDENVRTLMIFQPGGHEIHLEDEQKYTAEQRATPEILELLRSRHDYNPTDAVKEAQIANPPPPPAPGTQGPRGIRPVRKAPYPIKQRFVMHDQGETFTPKNEISTVKLTAEDTDGRYSLLDETWMPGMSAPPHLHEWHAEVFYIKEGQVEWKVGGETQTLGPGDLLYIPPNTVHSTKVVGDKPLKVVFLFNPGGYEYYWRRQAQFSPKQLEQPETRQLLRSEQDFRPAE